MMISVVIPVYYGENTITELCRRVIEAITACKSEYEIVLVNDASPDKSWEIITNLAHLDANIKGLSLSKNYGQHIAILAGLENSSGEYVVVMDCDLQDRPEEIVNMYHELTKSSYDMVLARRLFRNDSIIKKMSSNIFYRVFDYFIGSKTDSSIANFGIYKSVVIGTIIRMKSESFFFPASVSSAGFSRSVIDVKHDMSARGFSTYSIYKLIKLAIPVILTHSTKPLYLVAIISFAMVITLGAFIAVLFYLRILTLLVIGIINFIVLLLISSNAFIIGLYVAEMHRNNRSKYLYYVREKINI